MGKDRGIKITNVDSDKQCSIGVVANRTFRCLGCKHYDVKVVNDKGGTAKTCDVDKNGVRVIVDLDAPNCIDYMYGW